MRDRDAFLRELRHLYQASLEFKALKCWEWMHDSDIFGIENPENGEIGYCCVMGSLGQIFALALYLGSEGLEGYLKTASGEVGQDGMSLLHLQKCLIASFENREYLSRKDLEIIRALGLKFRGRNEWPLFRNYNPGYCPWYLSRGDVKFLTLALRQAADVCRRIRNKPDLLKPPKKGLYLVRVAEREGNRTIWKDEWLKPKSLRPRHKALIQLDELRLQRMKKYFIHTNGTWELDFFYSPFGIREGERPYFPLLFLLVDHDSYEIISFHLTGHRGYEEEFVEKFLTTIEKMKYLPRALSVKRKEIYDLFVEASRKLGIKIYFKDTLDSLEEAQESMFEYFSRKF